jgi:hypothetical protein
MSVFFQRNTLKTKNFCIVIRNVNIYSETIRLHGIKEEVEITLCQLCNLLNK